MLYVQYQPGQPLDKTFNFYLLLIAMESLRLPTSVMVQFLVLITKGRGLGG